MRHRCECSRVALTHQLVAEDGSPVGMRNIALLARLWQTQFDHSRNPPALAKGCTFGYNRPILAQMGIVVAGEERGEWCAGARNCAY